MTHPNHLQDSGADVRRATPEQIASHKAHIARQQRIAGGIAEPPPVEKPGPAPVPKPLWFGIVDEPRATERKINAADIKRAVAEHFKVSVGELISNRRFKNVILPRWIGMHLAKEMTSLSSPQIGRFFGDRDHTTVLHAFNKIDGLLQTDADLVATINTIRESIAGTK